jgi:hypothetical protein
MAGVVSFAASPFLVVAMSCCAVAASAAEPEPAPPVAATLSVNAAHVVRTADRRMLIGTNVALWNNADVFSSPDFRAWLTDMGPGLIRMPGGSWSDIVYWNGNGVRDAAGNVDPSRMKDGWPAVDYSAYGPSFCVNGDPTIRSDGWHGNVDVKTLHEFIRSIPGSQALVTVNAGTGRALDAAEWVRWANKTMGYNVRYWEVGNELGGSWEAGHYLPDGTELTGPVFAQRYEEFARAMKAVDPTIKVGCMDWLEDVLSRCGGLVDFISVHTYPLRSTLSEEEMLSVAVSDPARAVERVRGWVRRHQPAREDEIEIGVSEWNLGLVGGPELDVFAAIWTSLFVGEMFRNGVTFANQWDVFTHGRGGSLILTEPPYARKTQYWAFWLWRHYMGDSLLECSLDGPGSLKAFATRSEDALYIMALNSSHNDEVVLSAHIEGFEPAPQGEEAVLSCRQCFWNHLENRPEWSGKPLVLPVDVARSFVVTVPPSAIKCVRIPAAGRPGLSERAIQGQEMLARDHGPAELRVLIAPSGYADTEVEGWVLACRAGTNDPYPVPLPNARLEVTGPAQADRAAVRLAEAAGRFALRPTGPGEVTITASLADRSAGAKVVFEPSVPRPQVLWEFEAETLGRGYRSDWALRTDDSVRPNQRVARIDVPGVVPDQQHRLLLLLDLPGDLRLRRENIRGALFDLMASPELKCDDPNASVEVVMQSTANYWMPLGSLPLAEARRGWKTYTFMVTDEGLIRAMPQVYNIWFILHADKPVTGAVFIDRVGLMVR